MFILLCHSISLQIILSVGKMYENHTLIYKYIINICMIVYIFFQLRCYLLSN